VNRRAELPGLNLDRLTAWLDACTPPARHGELSVELIIGGLSNLTYLLRDAAGERVLRRPPLGHVLPTAHDMAREHRVLAALVDTPVPVPRPQLLCLDPRVLGAPFFVMDKIPGRVLRTPSDAATVGVGGAQDLSVAVVEVLAKLHTLDPAAVGLGDLGRPDGFLARQLRRWRTQLDASQSRKLPDLDRLHHQLGAAIPTTHRAAIVHGDYRLDNLLVDEHGMITAVLDWELATLGDPLTDLGLLLVYWDGLATLDPPPLPSTADPALGFATGAELATRYAAATGTELSRLPWYVAFGFFKLAVIAEGLHYRHTRGQTVGSGFATVGAAVPVLAAAGLATLDASS
jgi:aminoglycoside phosphotransferase (APT) family kinase protein